MKPLDRHELDLVARAIASGRRGYGARVDRVAESVAGLMVNRLRALGVAPERARSRRKALLRKAKPVDARTLKILLRRVDKHLGQRALASVADGWPPAH